MGPVWSGIYPEILKSSMTESLTLYLPRTKNSRSAEFAGRRFISQDHIIAKLVPTKKVFIKRYSFLK
ncbi:hypothetical protein TNIN_445051 [Trichonephila inaurata madagascariensis]|uniref:Uncharacterized protein n=1 Tax=Trichonephila inaurata madagascariensis TaxID=2747483 RepID=A0A8X7CC90_9ARAC|nr:hypothetical protein TNIN_445051 [Trichonephila inaurata madagascariensis]